MKNFYFKIILSALSLIALTARAQVKIGKQVWASANLDVTTFRNGDVIPEVKTKAEWENACKNDKPAWCYYANDPANGKKYGKLYNWFAVNDKRGLAPNGWPVPSAEEFAVLTDFLGGLETAGKKMKSAKGWNNIEGKAGNGTNTSGFNGLPGGFRNQNGEFGEIGVTGEWWCSRGSGLVFGYTCRLRSSEVSAYKGGDYGRNGYSVRCIKD